MSIMLQMSNMGLWPLSRLTPRPRGGTSIAEDRAMDPMHKEGVHLLAGPVHDPMSGPRFFGFIVLHIKGESGPHTDAAVRAAELAADNRAKATAAADDAFTSSQEAVALAAADAALDAGEKELKAAEARHAAAQEKYDGALAARKDPRAHRAPLNAAAEEVTDLRAWVGTLRESRADAQEAADRFREDARAAALRELNPSRAALHERRAALQEKADAAIREAAAELMDIEAIEAALRLK